MVQVKAHLRQTRAIPEAGGKSHLGPVAICRDMSQSMWLCFPNVELKFLFYTFEGAVVSYVVAVTEAGCPGMTAIAASALVSNSTYCVSLPRGVEDSVDGRRLSPLFPTVLVACIPVPSGKDSRRFARRC